MEIYLLFREEKKSTLINEHAYATHGSAEK